MSFFIDVPCNVMISDDSCGGGGVSGGSGGVSGVSGGSGNILTSFFFLLHFSFFILR